MIGIPGIRKSDFMRLKIKSQVIIEIVVGFIVLVMLLVGTTKLFLWFTGQMAARQEKFSRTRVINDKGVSFNSLSPAMKAARDECLARCAQDRKTCEEGADAQKGKCLTDAGNDAKKKAACAIYDKVKAACATKETADKTNCNMQVSGVGISPDDVQTLPEDELPPLNLVD